MTTKALTPGIAAGNKPAFGCSSLPLLSLSSKENADDDQDANEFDAKPPTNSRPTKADLYGEDELFSLLEMHKQLQPSMAPTQDPPPPENIESPNDLFAGGLHDFILQTIDEIDEKAKEEEEQSTQAQPWISDSAREKISKLDIIAVASDVDGTIIGFDQKIHPSTIDSIKAAQKSSKLKWIFPATGKTRWGARNSLGSELSSLTEGPGVYNQVRYRQAYTVCFICDRCLHRIFFE